MAAIPDAGGARYAPPGMVRALMRVVVLGGLVVAGWLLGSGISHASEALEQPGVGVVQLGSDPGDSATSSDGEAVGHFDIPPVAMSAVEKVVLPTAVVPRLHVQPAAILTPTVHAVGVAKPLAHVLAPVSKTVSNTRPGSPRQATGSQAQTTTDQPALVPSVEPAIRPAAATAPAPAAQRPAGPTMVQHAIPTPPACAAGAPAAKPFADQLALGATPVTPIPASPAGDTTAPCMISAAGGGASTRSGPDVAVTGDWATAGITPTQQVRYLSADDLLRSPAEQPSTSPD